MAAMNFPNGPSLGDKYPVTPIVGQPQYTWDGEKWTTVGSQISNATPSAAVPLMDATPGLAGTAAAYSRGDHVHPTDTTRAALAYVDTNMVGYAAQTTTANQKAQARANIAVTKRNYIINGGMQVSQENGAGSGTTNGYYPVDQFAVTFNHTGTQSFNQAASATPGGSPVRLRVTVTAPDAAVAAGEIFRVYQAIEGNRIADLRSGSAAAKTITIQFGVKAPAGTYCVSIRNGAVNRSYVAEYIIAAGEANTDVVKSVIIPLDQTGTWAVDTTAGMYITWALMGGTNTQSAANAWAAGDFTATSNQFNFAGTNGNVFELFDVSLTEGTVAPPFQLPDYVSELALCQRYFECWDAIVSGWSFAAMGSASATTTVEGLFTFKVAKRTSPTFAHNGVANFSVMWNGANNVSTCTALVSVYPTIYTVSIRGTATGSPLTLGVAASVGSTASASARMFFNARL